MLLGLATSKACEEVQQQNAHDANAISWECIAELLLMRASKDAETTLGIAEKSRSLNKVVKCQLLILQTDYEVAAHKCRAAIRNGSLLKPATRNEYLVMCARGFERAQELQARVPRDYQGRVQRGSASDVTTKAEWVRENFSQPVERILQAWDNLSRSIRVDLPGWRREEMTARRLISWRPVVQKAAALNRKCKQPQLN
ncbi:hypothetical protein OPQ81_007326 [Rhizoctonia solani]|nr:hypothetical protein OPQ81_007326 [Rhizoctonia solani]